DDARRHPGHGPRDPRRRQGHPRRGREHRHDHQAARGGGGRVDRGEPSALPRPAVHHEGRRAAPRRRDPLRRDRPPGRARRHEHGRDAAPARHRAGHQGRRGREGPRGLPRREGHRGPRRAARALRRVPRARSALRQVADGDERVGHAADRDGDRAERPRAGPLRRARAGGRAAAHRGARVDHGRRPRDRPFGRGHRAGPRRDGRRAAPPARRARGRAGEDEHGGLRVRRPRPGGPRRGRRPDPRGAAPHGPRRRARRRVPLRRAGRRAGQREPRRDRPPRPAALDHELLLRPRAAGPPDGDLGGRRGERRRRAGRVRHPPAAHGRRHPGRLERGRGARSVL
ncbi:MAG: Fructose-bisphosphate aldolase class I, partial [uncultured Actinomycetospora sp.]